MFAIRQHLPEKVLTVSCRPDLNSKQLVAVICGELISLHGTALPHIVTSTSRVQTDQQSRLIKTAIRSNSFDGRVLQSSDSVATFGRMLATDLTPPASVTCVDVPIRRSFSAVQNYRGQFHLRAFARPPRAGGRCNRLQFDLRETASGVPHRRSFRAVRTSAPSLASGRCCWAEIEGICRRQGTGCRSHPAAAQSLRGCLVKGSLVVRRKLAQMPETVFRRNRRHGGFPRIRT